MNLRRVKAVARKEFLHILRDPRSLYMALATPLLLLLLFGYALSLDVNQVPTVIYDLDKTSYRERIKARAHRHSQQIDAGPHRFDGRSRAFEHDFRVAEQRNRSAQENHAWHGV